MESDGECLGDSRGCFGVAGEEEKDRESSGYSHGDLREVDRVVFVLSYFGCSFANFTALVFGCNLVRSYSVHIGCARETIVNQITTLHFNRQSYRCRELFSRLPPASPSSPPRESAPALQLASHQLLL